MPLPFTKSCCRSSSGRLLLALFVFLVVTHRALAVEAVQITWDPNPEDNIAGYRIYYGQIGNGVTNIVEVGQATIGSVTNLDFSTTYFFYVTASNTFGLESDPSEVLLHTTRPPPSTPRPLSLTLDPYLIALSPSEVRLRAELSGDPDPATPLTISWTQLFGPPVNAIGNSDTLRPSIAFISPGFYYFQVDVSQGVIWLQTSTFVEVLDGNASGGSQFPITLSPPTRLADGIIYSWNSQPTRFYHIGYRKFLEDRFWILAARNIGSQGEQTYWVDDYILPQYQQGFFTVFKVP